MRNQHSNEQDAMNLTEETECHAAINQDKADDEDPMPEQRKTESIQFLRGRSQRSLDQWFEMAEHLAQKLDEDISKSDFTEICRQGAGIDYVTGTVWVRTARDKRVQLCRPKILTTAWTTLRPIPRLSDEEFEAMYHENLVSAAEPVPMTEKQIRAYQRGKRRPKKSRMPSKAGRSPFMDRLDFYSRIAELMQLLGDNRMMESDPRYQQHLERLGNAKTMVGGYLEQIRETLLTLLTRLENHEYLTMADGQLIHHNNLERDLQLASTKSVEPRRMAAPPDAGGEVEPGKFAKLIEHMALTGHVSSKQTQEHYDTDRSSTIG